MSEGKGRRLSGRRVYEGRVLAIDVDDVEEPGGVVAVREVVRHRGSVAALPVHDDGRVVLVRQYRYPVDEAVWELPAGRLDGGETPLEGARRELEEEVGLRAERLEPLSVFYTTPGFCDETMHLFRATGLSQVAARPEPDERIEAHAWTLDEARTMMRAGDVREAKTMVALLLESERRREGSEGRVRGGRSGAAFKRKKGPRALARRSGVTRHTCTDRRPRSARPSLRGNRSLRGSPRKGGSSPLRGGG